MTVVKKVIDFLIKDLKLKDEAEKTKNFIDKYHPKKIFVDHFDNAFPPVTRTVSVKRLKNTIKKRHPEIEFIIPEICKCVDL